PSVAPCGLRPARRFLAQARLCPPSRIAYGIFMARYRRGRGDGQAHVVLDEGIALMVKFASCQYAIELFGGWDAYAAHLEALVAEAVGEGAELLLLPEYSAMALAGLLPEAERSDLHGSIAGMQPFIPRWLELCEAMARRQRIWVCPGSAPVLDPDGTYRNRAYLVAPAAIPAHQDRIVMPRFERAQWFIDPRVAGLRIFAPPPGQLGILLCYDNEFPMLARRLAEDGVE